jgi:hypothetical protein
VSERAERTNPTHIAIAIAKYIYLTPRRSAHWRALATRCALAPSSYACPMFGRRADGLASSRQTRRRRDLIFIPHVTAKGGCRTRNECADDER